MRIGAFDIQEPAPQLKQPHAISILKPWVDVGSVGSLALAVLERHFGSQELGRLATPGRFFDFTRYRPTIMLVEGRRVFTVPNCVVNYAQTPRGPDFLFMHLLEPHSNAEEYVDSVVELVAHFKVERYIRIGGFYDAVPHTRPLLVTGSSAGKFSPEVARKLRLGTSNYQGPTSIMNLAHEKIAGLGIETLSIMAHLPNYVQLAEDYMGSARLLEVLGSIYDLPPELWDKRRGQAQYNQVQAEVEQNAMLKSVIQRLEASYDVRTAAAEEPTPPLSPEIQRFLEELGGSERSGGDS